MPNCFIKPGRRTTDPPYDKPQTPMAHFKAKVTKGKHKTQPFTVTVDKRVDTKVKQRYKTQYSAERGALRQFPRENTVRIELPGGRFRRAWMYADGSMHFESIVTPTTKRK